MPEEKNKPEEIREEAVMEEVKAAAEAEAGEQKPLSEDPLEAKTKELAELKDAHLRLLAEFDNYKRRTLKERQDLIKTAGADVIIALLPVLDDLDRAIKALSTSESASAMLEGVQLVNQKMTGILEQKGLKAMNSVGKEFDVELHEAISKVPVSDAAMSGKVTEELEKGYWLGDKVIRYAKVLVGS